MVNDQPGLAATMSGAKSALRRAANDDERRVVREELAQAMADFVASTSDTMPLQPELAPLPTAQVPLASTLPTPEGETGLEADDEMRSIFLEEARDVIDGARHALTVLERTPDDVTELTTVRRAFHTLKGSSRMVGLKAFGEAAWSCEQLYNVRLADHAQADAELSGLTTDALDYLGDWVSAIERGVAGGHDANAVREVVEGFRLHGHRHPLSLPTAPVAAAVVPPAPATPEPADAAPELGAMPDLMSLSDLEARHSIPGDLGEGRGQDHPDLVGSKAYHDTRMSEFAINLDPRTVQGLPHDFATSPFAATAACGCGNTRGSAPASADADVSSLAALHLDIKELSGGVKPPVKPPVPGSQGGRPIHDTLPFDRESGFAATQPAEGAAEEAAELEAQAMALRAEEEAQAAQTRQADEARRADEVRAADEAYAAHTAAAARADESRRAESARHAEEVAAAQVKQIGSLRVGLPLFNVYVNEAEAQAGELETELDQWVREHQRPVGERAVALAHSLAGNSATVGHGELSQLSRNLEHALSRSHKRGGGSLVEARLFRDVGAEIHKLVQQFAAGMLALPDPVLVARLADHETTAAAAVKTVTHASPSREDDIDAVDAVDAELFVIFEEEGLELLPRLAGHMRDWAANPGDNAGASASLRALHTIKGGARLAGAMRLGEMAHRLESSIEHLMASGDADTEAIEALEGQVERSAVDL